MSESRIPNVELAEVMAYAEAPYREFAATALQDGDDNGAYQLLERGTEISRVAARSYITSLLQLVDSEGISSDKECVYPELNFAQSISIHKQELLNSMCGVTADPRHKGGRLWSLLSTTVFDVSKSTGMPYVYIDLRSRHDKPELPLSHLMALLKYYDEHSAKNLHLAAPSKILGRNWGPAYIKVVRDFVAGKLEVLDDQSKLAPEA